MDNLKNFRRTNYCGDLRLGDTGKTVSLCGWVQRQRDLGGLIFVDLRDRTGLVQLSFDDGTDQAVFEKASSLRSEYVIAATGTVRERESKTDKIATGAIEVYVTELRLLAKAETPPFEIVEHSKANDMLRLKYRYLDLRRPDMQKMIATRHKVTKIARDYFDEQGFYEIETPMLTKSTPEGARDYLVPSRVHPGKFYALPQSPQQYKQLLMLSGFDRYMQIARCFRDEDLRADRQPEFTQIDLEMSFVNEDDVMDIQEGFLKRVFKEVLDVDVQTPFLRLPWREAMDRFGSDKPDMRFGFELKDISDIVKDCSFQVFSAPVAAGGSVRLINVEGGGEHFPRKKIDKLAEFVKTYKAKGLAWTRLHGGEVTSSYQKFLTEEENRAILERAGAKDGDLVLIVGDAKDEVVFAALGALRCECAKQLGILDPMDFKFLWVTEFPMFEYSEEEGRYVAMHHPFTAPMDEDFDKLETDKKNCRAKAYDIVLNGTELGGGSIRISVPETQEAMFRALGFSDEDAMERFGHLINAFKFGAPPHGGLAYGLDRLVMLMAGADSIRDVIAFPKVQNASEPMTQCPDFVDDKQLDELSINVTRKEAPEENA
ncbi:MULTISPECIES: aspartate--tRNA ligase [Eubacteriales]|uniref:aspartate--tRNA ligase n=1 Tax=Eubacteriales TaxID=186802 RepID=UPI0023F02136|nr:MULTISPECIES: aspartate--tRNA ligase [Eubacteriales]MBS5506329.1 aspartate--tRNA ligase [Oscillospiraceae bacterium]MEE0113457.1 aspartate--tRNA ligase [Eubacteriales bacterium]UMM46828.1 aspartate--tRNA ligase [Lawsonibacter asaccharolyticus]